MKRKQLIFTLILFWIVVIGSATFLVFRYIDNKTDRLHSEIADSIRTLFEGQESSGQYYNALNSGFFDDVFSGCSVKHYKEIPIPNYSSSSFEKQLEKRHLEDWKDSYGDLSSLYLLNWGDKYPNNKDQGWCLVRLYCPGFKDEEFIAQSYIFPYEVGLKGGGYASVQDAVNVAYNFYTTDSKSSFSNRFRRGSVQELWSKIYSYTNEYFSIVRNSTNANSRYVGRGIPGTEPSEFGLASPAYFENGYMHNGFYRVFIASSQETKYMLYKNESAIKNDRNNLLMWWLLGLTIAFWSIILPLTISQIKQNKKNKETLKERLCRLCNPKEFVANYNKDRLNAANEIYKELIDVKENNHEALSSLANRAIKELGISIVDESELEVLKERANPSNFTKPYDPDKVSIANEVYSLLEKERLTYEDYTKVKSLIEKL